MKDFFEVYRAVISTYEHNRYLKRPCVYSIIRTIISINKRK